MRFRARTAGASSRTLRLDLHSESAELNKGLELAPQCCGTRTAGSFGSS
jgi:hypothetical protein